MRNLFIMKLCFVLFVVALIGCGSGSSSSSGKTGSITAQLDWSHARSASGVHSATAPEGVVTVRIIVSGPGMTDIQQEFAASAGQGQIDNVPVGDNRVVTAQGLNSDGFLSYSGLKGNITVAGGQTNDVGTITMSTPCGMLVSQGKFVEARAACVSAADLYGDAVSNLADRARFFAALSRVAALWFNMQSDGNSGNGLNTVGDILDAFECNVSGRDPMNPKSVVCPSVLPASAPTGAALQAFIANAVKPELEGAIGNLGKIPQSFENLVWSEPFGGKQIISDYGDVLAMKAGTEMLLSLVIVEGSYSLNANIANAVNLKQTTQDFLASNGTFLQLADASHLGSAQGLLTNAADDAVAAINRMHARTDAQKNHFIGLGHMTTAEINDAISRINQLKATGPTDVLDNKGNKMGTANLGKFFAGVDLRSFLPTYTGNIPGFFPDPTFGGIWTNYTPTFDPNRDSNGDGSPDLLRKVHGGSASAALHSANKQKSGVKSRSH